MNQIAKDCAADLERRMVAQEVYDGQLECEIQDQIKTVYENADKWVFAWVEDPTELITQVFSTCAAYSGKKPDYELIGRTVYTIFSKEVESAAKYIVKSYD